jgi:hypothetical protein
MRRALEGGHGAADAPARWGALRQHVFYGALYHGIVLLANRRYAAVKPHRALSVRQEFRLYLKRLGLMPWHWLDRVAATRASCAAATPTTSHSCNWNTTRASATTAPSPSQSDFVETVIAGFAAGAPAHHHLVFKAHPAGGRARPLQGRHPPGRAQRRIGRPGAFRARREARAAARQRVIGGHRELHLRATGALARTSAQVLRGRRLPQAGIRLGSAAGRILQRARATR